MYHNLPMPPPEMQFYSLGKLCQVLQATPMQVLALATQVHVAPCEYRDAIPVYRGDAVEKMLAIINAARSAEQTSAERAASN